MPPTPSRSRIFATGATLALVALALLVVVAIVAEDLAWRWRYFAEARSEYAKARAERIAASPTVDEDGAAEVRRSLADGIPVEELEAELLADGQPPHFTRGPDQVAAARARILARRNPSQES